MVSADIKKYIIVLLSFLLIAGIIFVITLTYSVNISKYFSDDVQVNIVNAGDTEGYNGLYAFPLTDFTQNKYNEDKQRYYSIIELSGRSDVNDSLKLREISFALKSAQSGYLTININYQDGLTSSNNKFSLNLLAGQEFKVIRSTNMEFNNMSTECKITISIVAVDEESIPNPDNIAFAIYDLKLKE